MLADIEIELNASVRNEHVSEIEVLNRTTKDHIWSVYTELIQVYGRVSGVLVCKIIYAVKFWPNRFPAEDGISAMISSRAMIIGQSTKFTKHCLLDFREYVHTHEDRYNSMESRTIEALALHPTENSQGIHYFLNLHTGRVITCFVWTVLPLSPHIRKLVRRLVQQPPIALEVLYGLQHEYPTAEPDNDEADKEYVPGEYDKNSDDDDDDGDRGRDNDIDPPQEPADMDANDDDNSDIILNPSGPDHDGLIAGVTTDQDQTVVDTDTAVET